MSKTIKVAYITSDIIGVPYSYCVLLKKYGVETVLYRRISKSKRKYGGMSGNPLNIDIRYLKDNFILRYLQIFKLNFDYDILHLHEGGGIFESIFCGFGKAKIIYHFHGSPIRENMPNFTIYSKIRKMYWKYLGIHSKALVSTSDLLQHWKGAELLLDPIDQTILKRKTQRNIDQPYILSPHYCDNGIKGTNIVFSAWNILKKKYPKYTLHVINFGKDAPYYKKLTESDKTVIWHDFLPREDFINLLSGATVNWGEFIIPAYGLTEIEAFSLGVPDISGPNITDVELAERTENLVLDSELRSIVIEKQKQIVERYNSDILSKKLYEIYMEVLK
jgi:hypothetical protein